jgi:hypothetical protein
MRVDACLVRQQLPLLEMIAMHAKADRFDHRIIFEDLLPFPLLQRWNSPLLRDDLR